MRSRHPTRFNNEWDIALSDGQRQFVLNAMKTVVSRAKLATVPVDRKRVVEQCVRKLSRSLEREGVSKEEIASL